MPTRWEKQSASVVMLDCHPPAYAREWWDRSLAAVLQQDTFAHEVVVVDNRGGDATLNLSARDDRIVHLPGDYANRAAMFNAGLAATTADYVLLLVNDTAPVVLRRSTLRTLLMAAERAERVGMVYGDYELTEADGRGTPCHLLDHHPGRLRETIDYGKALLFPTEVLRSLGGLDETYIQADLYDLRLRVCEGQCLVHVANRHDGALYGVVASAEAHNVFDYLLTDRKTQDEHERALSEHLRRIGAYLSPERKLRSATYAADQERTFDDCIASVVIPVHRRPEFIGTAIESVLNQTRRDVEVIVVVNGGESDPTANEVRRYMDGPDGRTRGRPEVRLVVVDINNIGFCLNVGIGAARGKYYVQLDSDDRLKPNAVEKLIGVFESDPTVGMVIGAYEVWDLNPQDGTVTRNRSIPVVAHEEWTDQNGPNNLLRINGAGAPRAAHIKVIEELGGFGVNDSPHCRNYGEDYDLVLRVSEHYRIGRVWEPICEVVRHPGGTDHSIDQATIDRNNEAKDLMRLRALRRRQRITGHKPIGAGTIIGVDGGATKVRVHHVLPPNLRERRYYQLGSAYAERIYPNAEDFSPVEVLRQLEERAAGRIELTTAERRRSEAIVDAVVDCIADVTRRVRGRRMRIGIGMPGLKTADGRGIAVINSGPRMPDLADRLEAGLRRAGFDLAASIAHVGSDGDYCGVGEQYAAEGLFRDVQDAYYVGGGTGLAEALKLRGRLVSFDEAASWIAKAWQIPSSSGPTLEQLGSAAGMNKRYRDLCGLDPDRPTSATYPERLALLGDPIARNVLETTARTLAELMFERLDTVYGGRRQLPHRGDDYLRLQPEHDYRGLLLERIVLGQQIGRLYAADEYAPFFRAKFDAFLAEFIAELGDVRLRACALEGNALRGGLVVPSKLRAAPAIGAAIAATQESPDGAIRTHVPD